MMHLWQVSLQKLDCRDPFPFIIKNHPKIPLSLDLLRKNLNKTFKEIGGKKFEAKEFFIQGKKSEGKDCRELAIVLISSYFWLTLVLNSNLLKFSN